MTCNLVLCSLCSHICFLFLRRTGRICSIFSVWIKRFLFAMYIFRTPAKKLSREKCRPYVNFNLKNPTWRSSHWKCSIKKFFSKVSQNSQKNIGVGVSFSIKLQVSGSSFIKKENPIQKFFCEFCENLFKMFVFYWVHPGDCFYCYTLL